jgi:ribosomal protein S18 acetylase RimI-like enzyme
MKKIPGYEIRTMQREEFMALWSPGAKEIFADQAIFRVAESLSAAELAKQREVSQMFGMPFDLYLGVFAEEKFVGWAWGFQDSFDSFYMCNSAVLPEHRRKGIYSALLEATIENVSTKGFQRITSRHAATNNSVIIPKLKFGFVITSLEVSDVFGTLVHLTYFTHPLRRKMIDYRVGQIRSDQEIERALAGKKS